MNNKREKKSILDMPRIPIRCLRFSANDPQHLPGNTSASSVTSMHWQKSSRHEVEFIPGLRHYLVTFHNRSTGQDEYALVHESVPLNATLPPPEPEEVES